MEVIFLAEKGEAAYIRAAGAPALSEPAGRGPKEPCPGLERAF